MYNSLGLEGQRIIITEAPMINVSTPNGQRLLIVSTIVSRHVILIGLF